MLIRVTPQHIAQGRRNSCTLCPIALALIAAGIVAPFVFERSFSCRVNFARLTFQFPESAFDFRWVFDMGAKVFPFEFEVPDAAIGG